MKIRLNPILYFLLLVVSFSCSDDDQSNISPVNTPSAEEARQVRKITETVFYGSDSDTYTIDFNYENGTLKSYQSGTDRTTLEYDGPKITKAVYSSNGTPDGSTTFYYQGDRLSYTQSDDADQEKTEYTYQNGQLSSSRSGYMNDGEYVLLQMRRYTFENANLIEKKINGFIFGSEESSRFVYTHDDKINPLKYMNPYLRLTFSSEGLTGLGDNNIISSASYWNNSSTPSQQEYEIIYDGNYPVLIRKKTASGALISETQIEYL